MDTETILQQAGADAIMAVRLADLFLEAFDRASRNGEYPSAFERTPEEFAAMWLKSGAPASLTKARAEKRGRRGLRVVASLR